MNKIDAVVALEERLRLAQLQSDTADLEALIDPDLVFTGLDGQLIGREDDIALHETPGFSITRMDVLDRKIIDLGEVVTVIVLMDAIAVMNGAEQAAKIRYTRIWKRGDGGWRLAAGHMSALQE
jgi:ketosteroid isomerase-like protein